MIREYVMVVDKDKTVQSLRKRYLDNVERLYAMLIHLKKNKRCKKNRKMLRT